MASAQKIFNWKMIAVKKVTGRNISGYKADVTKQIQKKEHGQCWKY